MSSSAARLRPSLYMVNEDGQFATRDLGAGVLPFLVASVSAADYDGDGLLDVYFSTYAARMLLAAAPSPLPELSLGEARYWPTSCLRTTLACSTT